MGLEQLAAALQEVPRQEVSTRGALGKMTKGVGCLENTRVSGHIAVVYFSVTLFEVTSEFGKRSVHAGFRAMAFLRVKRPLQKTHDFGRFSAILCKR